VVDACQGVQAQTVANFWLAFEAGLNIIPVINKVRLPASEGFRVLGIGGSFGAKVGLAILSSS
jgi:translation elongation factor EF-4